VTRVKVARNDGTSLADYLLDGAMVNKIAVDGQGRKWFATNGGGITCTSSSGSEVVNVYTAENSLLPSDYVYGLCYNPANNSMMISTDSGLAELYLSGVAGGSDEGSAIAYPNPVRPDYFGYVNIEGLEDGSLVKITDSGGNLIKELGFAEGGSIKWDVTNLNNKRVRSGVYYVLASGSADSSGFAAATKILVVN
ncbi:MAG: T9SS type A sorting domain-containing protein, partial [Muribaculaceae bacterium]|nr:T9SS type A sorting domain-containing protein [Muribaculaceae bacterium]